MTYKFKIGDHVRLPPYHHCFTYKHAGETATVTSDGHSPDIELDQPCTIHEEGECSADWWNQDCLELAEPKSTKEMTTWQDRLDGLLNWLPSSELMSKPILREWLATFIEAELAEAYKAGFIKGSLENKQAEADINSPK